MPRVLRIINRLNLGGPTYNVAYLTKYMAPEFDTMLIAGMTDETEASSEFIIKKLGISPVYVAQMYREINLFKDWQAYYRIKKIIRDFKPDVVHTHAAKAGAIGRLAAYNSRVPVVLHTFHGHVFHSYFSPLKTQIFIAIEKYLAKKSTRLITISNQLKKELSMTYKITTPGNIEVISLGLDLQCFRIEKGKFREEFRSNYLIAPNDIVIVIVGRLVPVKNHLLFLKALKKVTDNTHKRVRAFIVGDGEERSNIEASATNLGIDWTNFMNEKKRATLTFTSWIQDVKPVYCGADIVVLSSLNEGTPVSLLEAQAAGLPIVTTNVGGITDIVKNNSAAFVVNSNDPESFAQAILKLVNNDNLRSMSTNYEVSGLVEQYGYQQMVKEMKALYFRLLNHA